MRRRSPHHLLRTELFLVLVAFAVAFTLVATTQVAAHFLLNLNVRVFHVDHVQRDLILHVRTPMPYLLADKLGAAEGDGLPEPAPFTRNTREEGRLVHYVDPAQIAANPLGVGQIAEGGLALKSGGVRLRGTVERVALHEVGKEPGFATLDEARLVFERPFTLSALPEGLYVGDTVVDVRIRYETNQGVDAYSFSSLLNPGLLGQEETANLLLDYRGDTVRTYRARGLLLKPIEVTGSVASAVSTFVVEGIRHILEGLDHVLFVLCMVLGAATLRSLVARVTGFTLGHTVTLIMGFFGLAPQGSWFIPSVETLIALSIILAAADAVLRPPKDATGNGRAVTLTALIGLLHGFGFSFMLQNILKVDAPNVWQSLVAFNVGVELGQLLIVAAIWPLVLFLRSRPPPVWRMASVSTAIAASVLATIWVIDRVGFFFA